MVTTTAIPSITPAGLYELLEQGRPVELIDVRTPAEYRSVHADPAECLPLERIDPEAIARRHGSESPTLYFICRSGQRARKAAERCLACGYTNVACVEGGTDAWTAEGLPVVRGRQTMSLERQVRIAAGALVLVGLALAVWLNPWFALISGFVGAGLIFAGITDSCGMASVLSRMPWNRA